MKIAAHLHPHHSSYNQIRAAETGRRCRVFRK